MLSRCARRCAVAGHGARPVKRGFNDSAKQSSRSVHASRSQSQPSADAAQNTTSHAPAVRELHSALGVGTSLKFLALAVTLAAGYYYVTDTRAGVHGWLVSPLLRLAYRDAEEGHTAGIRALAALHAVGLHPRERAAGAADTALGGVEVFGHRLANPIGISAGLDKDAAAVDALFALGPAVVEVGGVTPLPQEGNPKPRVWRVPSQQAIINRYGLNSAGAAAVALRLRERVRAFADARGLGLGADAERAVLEGRAGVPTGSLASGRILAVQVAKNKATPDGDVAAVRRDYVACVERLAPYADVVVVNVSSPNTPGLRALQRREPLLDILTGVVEAARRVPRGGPYSKPVAVMVKVSPDEDSEEDVGGICEAVWRAGVDGVVVANTTKARPPLPLPSKSASGAGNSTSQTITSPMPAVSPREARALAEQGGYSGPALLPRTLALVARYRAELDRPLARAANADAAPKVIFASGGICTGADALAALRAGASVAMTYTALSYRGSGHVTEVKRQMRAEILAAPAPGGAT